MPNNGHALLAEQTYVQTRKPVWAWKEKYPK